MARKRPKRPKRDDGQFEFKFDAPEDPFINPQETRKVAKDAMRRAELLSGDHWKVEMREAILALAREMRYFKADHVWKKLGRVGDGKRDNGSGLGPMLIQMQKEGIIRRIVHEKSQRPVTHGKPVTVWESLIYVPEWFDRRSVNGCIESSYTQ